MEYYITHILCPHFSYYTAIVSNQVSNALVLKMVVAAYPWQETLLVHEHLVGSGGLEMLVFALQVAGIMFTSYSFH